jgi:hypothetical protein
VTHGVAASATESERLTDLGRERSALIPGASLRIVLESFTDIIGNLHRLRRNDKTARASILAKYNLMAKPVQINPRKTKEKGLDFLGFLWPNRDFSTRYSDSK